MLNRITAKWVAEKIVYFAGRVASENNLPKEWEQLDIPFSRMAQNPAEIRNLIMSDWSRVANSLPLRYCIGPVKSGDFHLIVLRNNK